MYGSHSRDLRPFLHLAYWRERQQSAVLDVFTELCKGGLISPRILKTPISLASGLSQQVATLTWLLSCFDEPARDRDITAAVKSSVLIGGGPYDYHLFWLATVISRSYADIGDLFQHILKTRYLGGLDEKRYAKWQRSHTPQVFATYVNEGAPKQEKEELNLFASWLPSGVNIPFL